MPRQGRRDDREVGAQVVENLDGRHDGILSNCMLAAHPVGRELESLHRALNTPYPALESPLFITRYRVSPALARHLFQIPGRGG